MKCTSVWNGVQVTSLLHVSQYMSLFDPHMTPWGKTKIPNPYCISARHAISYSLVSILYSWKIRCSSSGKLYRKKKHRFSTPIWPLVKKMKIPKPCYKEHQTISRVLFVYSMKCRQSSSDNNFTINIICWPLIDPWGKNENSKTLLHISKTYPIRSYYTIWLRL